MATKKDFTHDTQALIDQAVKELGIDVPVMATRFVGNRLELHLYGGEVKKVELEEDIHADDGATRISKASTSVTKRGSQKKTSRK